MNQGYKKYRPFEPVAMKKREWPDNTIKHPPIWCSVDLRDGNQALVEPMSCEEKIEYFKILTEIGFKEIEVGFPSASETEYGFLRALIERDLIPDDVTIQVLVQAREHLIRRTFESISGAKNVIVHFYNSTSTLQRKVVFQKDMQGIIDIAVNGAKLIRELTEEIPKDHGCNIRFEYSPESFSGTEIENAVEICDQVLDALGATPDNKVILNLPSTVQLSIPNHYADQIEAFVKRLRGRDSAVISVHPHNDRGTGVADAELALLAGAERIEGTLFGNGERTGNVDIITLGLNLFTQGIDPGLDFSRLNEIKRAYERCVKMHVHERHPYAGELVFTAFSGSHQDAINKGVDYMSAHHSNFWEVPYLPIDPADVGRQYEPFIRINSQSGKGGAAFILKHFFGFDLPKAMHPEFGAIVQKAADATGKEQATHDVMELFRASYLDVKMPYRLRRHNLSERAIDESHSLVSFEGSVLCGEIEKEIQGCGNGPIDAFFAALRGIGITGFEFVSYHEHAASSGSDAKAVAYIELKALNGKHFFGVGMHSNINVASMRAILCAINRASV